jgi:hypothetical protein
MERRYVIATAALVLSLTVLVAAGLYAVAAPTGLDMTRPAEPRPGSVIERPQPLSALPGVATEDSWQFALAGMSGEFAKRLLADAGGLRAPSIYVPADSWRLRAHSAHSGHHRTPATRRAAVMQVA